MKFSDHFFHVFQLAVVRPFTLFALVSLPKAIRLGRWPVAGVPTSPLPPMGDVELATWSDGYEPLAPWLKRLDPANDWSPWKVR